MAKKDFVMVMLAVMLACGFSLSGCSTTSKSLERMNPVGGSYQDIKVPNKDFESKGLVFAEYTSEGDGAGSESGEVYTFYKLLREAQKAGADAIVNVVIEGAEEFSREILNGKTVKEGVTKKTWYGSATAIKYTDTIKVTNEKSVVVVGPDGKEIVSEKASSGSVPLAPAPDSPAGGVGGGADKGADKEVEFKLFKPSTWGSWFKSLFKKK